ncbi:MAG: tRNA uracil 4-sulfurtransferase ThiI [Candidatus Metalachnospira sp.]|nr:tRNA uracil 4-sulfurtransferase ThiI [Candidatus Metalachnospira sp.]
MEEKVLIVRYGEIAMRGNNRKVYITRLVNSIRKNLNDIGEYYVVREQGRLIVEYRGGEMDFDKVIPKVICILGIIGVCPAVKTTDQDIENIKRVCNLHMSDIGISDYKTFKIETKRSDKRYPLESREVSAAVGEYILDEFQHLTVDVHNPDLIVNVELRNDAYVYSKLVNGFGGLPVGSSGKGIAMLSGGIDSPVAAFMMAKRGVEVEGVYFNSPPYTSERAKQKVIDLAERLSVFTGGFRLYVVPFTDLQLYLLDNVPHDKLTIFLKRAMTRVACAIGEKDNSLAVITGDSVGQVASQTMQGLHAISAVATMPILRPLAGFDKQEIVDIARKIGTFDISIRPYEDCCTIFVAKHPETKPKTSVIDKIESQLAELDKYLEEAINNAEILEL